MKLIVFIVMVLLGLSAGLGWWFYQEYVEQNQLEQQERMERKERLKKQLLKQAQAELKAKQRQYKKNSKWHILYAFQAGDLGDSENYVKHLLTLALNRTVTSHGTYSLEPVILDDDHPDSALKALKDKQVDLIILPGLEDYNQDAMPITIPLLKGILSFHLIERRSQDFHLQNLKSLDQLKKQTAYIPKNTALDSVLADHFLISHQITEADYRLAHIAESNDNKILSEQHCLQIPMPRLFYVHSQQTKLQERIQRGLELCIYDGSMERAFHKFCGPLIEKAKLERRSIWEISNPLINKSISLTSSTLWYQITY